jgi:hypothetical protein
VPLSIGMMESAWAKMANMAKTVSGNLAKVAKDTKTPSGPLTLHEHSPWRMYP